LLPKNAIYDPLDVVNIPVVVVALKLEQMLALRDLEEDPPGKLAQAKDYQDKKNDERETRGISVAA
jgi:hypothetical protein